MPISAEWDNEQKTVVHVHIAGRWTWEEMEAAVNRVIALLDTVDHKVDSIFNASGAGPIPPNAFTYLGKMNRVTHPNQASVAVVGLTPMARTLMNTFSKVYGLARGSDTCFLPTLDKARAFLAEQQSKR